MSKRGSPFLQVLNIFDEEEKACRENVEVRVRPLLVKEARKVRVLKRVVFGKGDALLEWRCGEKELASHIVAHPDVYGGVMWKFAYLCNFVAERYPVAEITEEDLAP